MIRDKIEKKVAVMQLVKPKSKFRKSCGTLRLDENGAETLDLECARLGISKNALMSLLWETYLEELLA